MPLKEECGVFGIWDHPEAARLVYLGLYSQQHRGQESAGISTISDEGVIYSHVDMGLVHEVFNEDNISRLVGGRAIGHVRYSTTGSSQICNAQPIVRNYARGQIAFCFNGNIVNAQELRHGLEEAGSIFQGSSDGEVIVHLVARQHEESLLDRVANALRHCQGAYSALFMNQHEVLAVRDPHGFRPLCLGKLGAAWMVASESCAFDIVDGEYVRDLRPGEVLRITDSGLESFFPFEPVEAQPCIFELVYFARPDSIVFERDVNEVRKRLGRQLAIESHVDADLVFAVPDSSNLVALGFSQESGIPFEIGLMRNHYVGRTFIEPEQSIRDFGAKIKYSPLRSTLRGQRVVVVDDSIVRGTTVRKIVKMIRKAGAAEVHLRIASPPIRHACFYGIDMPTTSELIASTHSPEEIRRHIRVDSLHYLSVEGLLEACRGTMDTYCTACFSGRYAIDFSQLDETKFAFERRPLVTV
ncbi:MAG: amidophosphoribosyltransferase [Candidatus Omnitrophica bacterium]|nr:Amidophosphoribosyltransferase [bacterium]NUN96674.1 amidophosphoribosyltransferase [Candidatus Omnitrophota bacterium]